MNSLHTALPRARDRVRMVRGAQFIRIGYYVNLEYDAPELNESPPSPPVYERIVRNILADRPRVTRYQIDWGEPPTSAERPLELKEEGGLPMDDENDMNTN